MLSKASVLPHDRLCWLRGSASLTDRYESDGMGWYASCARLLCLLKTVRTGGILSLGIVSGPRRTRLAISCQMRALYMRISMTSSHTSRILSQARIESLANSIAFLNGTAVLARQARDYKTRLVQRLCSISCSPRAASHGGMARGTSSHRFP